MKFPKRFMVGGRIAKTGIAVFVTALICHLLNWPAMFAVITAIVTIEPTASDSIRKAFVRFPASAIGTAFAVLFTFLFQDSAFSFAFVSLATIMTCHKLKLYDGTLVAAITGAAMVTTVHDHYIASFFVRLATTSTGLVVSTLVNVFVMPPKYSIPITNGIHALYRDAGAILEKRGKELLRIQTYDQDLRQEFKKLVKQIDKIELLCLYQKDEWKFHRVTREDIRTYRFEYKKLTTLHQIVYHIGNLMYLPSHDQRLEEMKTAHILSAIQFIQTIFEDENPVAKEEMYQKRNELTRWFQTQSSSLHVEELKPDQHHYISPETALLYEILSIYDLTIELSQINRQNLRSQQLLKNGVSPPAL